MAIDIKDRKNEDRVNRLYWNSDLSVNAIGEEMGLSKGRLYQFLRPLPSGLGCPKCGGELGYENRTARERDQVSCPQCGFEGERDEARPEPEAGANTIPFPVGAAANDRGSAVVPTVVGGLMVGAAAGILLGRYLRH